MTIEDARKELKRVTTIINGIKSRKRRLETLKSELYKIRLTNYDGVCRGTTTAENDRLEKIIDECEQVQTQIADGILKMAIEQEQINAKIERLPFPYSRVLQMRFVDGYKFEKIAVELDFTYRHVTRLLHDGIKKYSEL